MFQDNFDDIQYLFDYEPDGGKYGNFHSYVIMCAHKIGDIFQTLCNARFNIEAITAQDYGILVENTNDSLLYMRQNLYQNALFSYNIVVDLTWQLGWLFCRVDYEEIPTKELHDMLVKTCTYEKLLCYLRLWKQYELEDVYEEFYKYIVNSKIRTDYNYLKHRGAFYFDGLGTQYTHSMGAVGSNKNTHTYPFVYRPIINLDKYSNDLIEFDKVLVKYIRNLVTIIMPNNYLATDDVFSGMCNYGINLNDKLIEYREHKDKYIARIKSLYDEKCR